MKSYRTPPRTENARTEITFTKADLLAALGNHAIYRGEVVPVGKMSVYGLERSRESARDYFGEMKVDGPTVLTLVIEETPQ